MLALAAAFSPSRRIRARLATARPLQKIAELQKILTFQKAGNFSSKNWQRISTSGKFRESFSISSYIFFAVKFKLFVIWRGERARHYFKKNPAKKFCVKPRIIPYNFEDFLDALRLKNILKTILLQFIFLGKRRLYSKSLNSARPQTRFLESIDNF